MCWAFACSLLAPLAVLPFRLLCPVFTANWLWVRFSQGKELAASHHQKGRALATPSGQLPSRTRHGARVPGPPNVTSFPLLGPNGSCYFLLCLMAGWPPGHVLACSAVLEPSKVVPILTFLHETAWHQLSFPDRTLRETQTLRREHGRRQFIWEAIPGSTYGGHGCS